MSAADPWVGFGLVVLGIGFAIFTVSTDNRRPPMRALGFMDFAPALAVAAAGLILLLLRPVSVAVVRRRLIATGRCPACGYGMAGLAPETDRCCVCPECNAAWRLSRDLHLT
jgi:hypothetical protein